ncbi:hypothetical protein VNO78_09270 [Psophocarpus tetragonolobus]|uniref:Uncharacterized protein n=1 Tax=Psophocarpus tetragonolobus TaxID=3891 RepID=A0AAN9SZ20_PSOTE
MYETLENCLCWDLMKVAFVKLQLDKLCIFEMYEGPFCLLSLPASLDPRLFTSLSHAPFSCASANPFPSLKLPLSWLN